MARLLSVGKRWSYCTT